MRDFGLTIRMAIVGSILFGFYIVVALFISAALDVPILPVLVAGIVLLPAAQYKIGKWLSLRNVGAEDMPEYGQYQRIHHMTESLSRDMGIDKPRLMVAQMGVPNAFATGRRGAGVVVVSTELIQILEPDELEGVIAHEIAHIRNRDVITMVIGQSIATIVGYVVFFAIRFGGRNNIAAYFLAILGSMIANFIVMLFVLAISRYREYIADADAKRAIGSGDPLARALEKISSTSQQVDSELDDSVAALCILNTDRSIFQQILSTHPPTEKRIARLRS